MTRIIIPFLKCEIMFKIDYNLQIKKGLKY